MESLDDVLQDWAEWHQRERTALGYPAKAAGFATGGLRSFEDMYDSVKASRMDRVQASVDSLAPIQAAAITMAYGVAGRFRFPMEDFEAALETGKERLAVLFRAKGVI